jgi:hypothetical protein
MFHKESYANKIVLVAIELTDILVVKLHMLILQERTRWNSSKDFIKRIVFDTITGIVHKEFLQVIWEISLNLKVLMRYFKEFKISFKDLRMYSLRL